MDGRKEKNMYFKRGKRIEFTTTIERAMGNSVLSPHCVPWHEKGERTSRLFLKPYSCKNRKAWFSRSSSAGLTSKNSFSWSELERSSTEKGMLYKGLISSFYDLISNAQHVIKLFIETCTQLWQSIIDANYTCFSNSLVRLFISHQLYRIVQLFLN